MPKKLIFMFIWMFAFAACFESNGPQESLDVFHQEMAKRIPAKVQKITSTLEERMRRGEEVSHLIKMMQQAGAQMDGGRPDKAEAIMDRILVQLDKNKAPLRISQTSYEERFTDTSIPKPPSPDSEVQYLLFSIQAKGMFEARSSQQTAQIIERDIQKIVDRVGTIGSGASRLGIKIMVPPWIIDRGLPHKWPIVVQEAFNIARKKDIPIYFSLTFHHYWPNRIDLWSKRENVEWSDWEGTTLKARYLPYGAPGGGPSKVSPHMCYNSPMIKSEVARLSNRFIAPPIVKEIKKLKREGKEYLFAGMTVGDEPRVDNYIAFDKAHKPFADFIRADGQELVRLGYCALTNSGYSKSNPPKNMLNALAKVNQEFVADWAKGLVQGGISKTKIYTHIAANVTPALLEYTNAPISVAFNEYSRPGWTTYPDGPLKKDFKILYDELAGQGVKHWGSTEASPMNLAPQKYLDRHFNHGATVLVLNTGDPELGEGVFWSKEALAAYRRFLRG